ncbi:MAG TPA: citramalate synthase [Clostridiales bacterium]|nr:citramalate synthase [Clostridiales bacterium]
MTEYKNNVIEIFDSTLRDGAQSEGINFSLEDKLEVVKTLDAFGVKYIEAGNPGSNPKDLEFFKRVKGLNLKATLVAFGSTRRKNIKAEDDKNIASLLSADTSTVAIFGKSWKLHVTEIINTTPEENLNMIQDTISYLKSKGKKIIYDAEHFFDGYKDDPDYALKTLEVAYESGAEILALCDTNGGCFPHEIYDITKTVIEKFKDVTIGIHCHNDNACAEANSIIAVKAGAKHVQGTFLGYGERCGNANLSAIIPSLQLKLGYSCVAEDKIAMLTHTAKKIAEISNTPLAQFLPYVGSSAFTHKAGMHADGVLKVSHSFEHINPEAVGNERKFVLSEIAGRNVLASKIRRYFPELTKDSPKVIDILNQIKQMEHDGYQFESAEATFLLIVYKALGLYTPQFELISYSTNTQVPSEDMLSATAIVKIKVLDKYELTCAQGDGPVNALDIALRKALEVFYPSLAKMSLIDYKVRVLDSKAATAAKVRVLITSTDGNDVWTTVGVSTNIIEASFKALVDSIEYKLMTDKKIIPNGKS